MKVLAPFVRMDYRTAIALGRYIPEDRLETIYTGADDYAYWHAVYSRWTGEQDLMIVEHDIEIHEGVYESLRDCPEPWCSFSYKAAPLDGVKCTDLSTGFGCAKFSAEAQRLTKDFPKSPQVWDIIDRETIRLMGAIGMQPHVHGKVKHHHLYRLTYLPSPSLKDQRFIWSNEGRPANPTVGWQGEINIPANAESIILNAGILDDE